MATKKRRYKRWVSIGPADLARLVWLARSNGMDCIRAFKPDMHVYNEIGLYGTAEQMNATEEAWGAISSKDGVHHEILDRKPQAAFGFDANIPHDEWTECKLPDVGTKPQGTTWRGAR
jgi:hypothetical protein